MNPSRELTRYPLGRETGVGRSERLVRILEVEIGRPFGGLEKARESALAYGERGRVYVSLFAGCHGFPFWKGNVREEKAKEKKAKDFSRGFQEKVGDEKSRLTARA